MVCRSTNSWGRTGWDRRSLWAIKRHGNFVIRCFMTFYIGWRERGADASGKGGNHYGAGLVCSERSECMGLSAIFLLAENDFFLFFFANFVSWVWKKTLSRGKKIRLSSFIWWGLCVKKNTVENDKPQKNPFLKHQTVQRIAQLNGNNQRKLWRSFIFE